MMIAQDHLRQVAAWSQELDLRESEVARIGIVERSYAAQECIFMRGDRFHYWAGVVTGLARVGVVSRGGKQASFASLAAGAWFGEGSVLRNEARRHDVIALRDTRLALMDRRAFVWLFENSVAFNRFLVRQLNERRGQVIGQVIGQVEYSRTRDMTTRVARGIASLFNPVLYPNLVAHLEIKQEEVGALSGISRQNTNRCLNRLEKEGMLRLEHGGITVPDVDRLRRYGE